MTFLLLSAKSLHTPHLPNSTFRRENFSHKIFDGLIVKIGGGNVKVQAHFRKLPKINFIIHLIFRYQREKLLGNFI
jgi:hypothetical protein